MFGVDQKGHRNDAILMPVIPLNVLHPLRFLLTYNYLTMKSMNVLQLQNEHKAMHI